MADGSLKFDTKINTEGFEQGTSTLERALDRLTGAIERLNANITGGFRDTGKAAVQTSRDVSKIGEEAGRSEQQVKDLKEQMDAVQVSHYAPDVLPDNVPEAERRVPVSRPDLYGYDKAAMEYINSIGEAKEETNEFLLEISRLEQQIKGLESQGMYFGDEEYDQAYLKLAKVKQALSDYKRELTSPTPDAVIFPADSLRGKIEQLRIQLKHLEAAGRSFGDALYDSTYQSLTAAEQELAQYRKSLTAVQTENPFSGMQTEAGGFAGMIGTVKNALNGMPAVLDMVKSSAGLMFTPAGMGAAALTMAIGIAGGAAKKFFGVLTGAGKMAINAFKSLVMKAANALLQLGKAYFFAGNKARDGNRQMSTLGILWKSVMFSLVFRAISSISRAIKEGSDNLALYSGQFNQVLSSFTSSLGQLKNTIASAFIPITSVVIPVIDMLIQKIISVINVIGQFLSALGGKGTFIRAVKVNKDYADGLEKTGSAAEQAGKDAKKALAPFDQLNELWDKGSGGSGGGGGGSGAGSMFEEVEIDSGISSFAERIIDAFKAEDYEEVGRIIGEKINEAVKGISGYISWNRVGKEITRIVDMVTTIFNSTVDTINWDQVGRMFGEGINTVTNTLYQLLTKTDWKRLGKAFGQGLNGLVYEVDWNLLGNTIGAYFQSKIAGLHGFVTEADWPAIGLALQESVSGLIEEIDWEMLGEALAIGLSGLFKSAKEFVTTFDWSGFGSRLADSVSTFLENFDWATAGEAVGGFVEGLLDLVITFIEEMDWKALTDGIATFLDGVDWSVVGGKVLELISLAVGTAFGSFHAFIGKLISDKITEAKEEFQQSIEDCGGDIVAGILLGVAKGMLGINKWILDNVFKPFFSGINNAFGIDGGSAASMEGIGSSLWEGFCKGIKLLFGAPIKFVRDIITDPFVNAVKTLFGISGHSTVMEGVGSDTVAGFNEGVAKEQGETQSVVQGWASGVAKWFSEKFGIGNNDAEESKKWAGSIMSGFNTEVERGYTDSQSGMEQWAGSARDWFTGTGESKGVNDKTWKKFADDVTGAFPSGIQSGTGNTRVPMTSWAKNAKDWFWGASYSGGNNGMYQEFYQMAKLVNQGFTAGIGAFTHLAQDTMRKWGSQVLASAKSELDIHSPSREAYAIAEYFIKGFNNGLLAMLGSSVSTAEKWLDKITGVFDGVEIGIPVGLNIPNAASYLPRMASGSAVPPKAGEFSSKYAGKYRTGEEQDSLLSSIGRMLKEFKGPRTEGGDIHLTVNLDGKVVYDSVVEHNRQARKITKKNPLLV